MVIGFDSTYTWNQELQAVSQISCQLFQGLLMNTQDICSGISILSAQAAGSHQLQAAILQACVNKSTCSLADLENVGACL